VLSVYEIFRSTIWKVPPHTHTQPAEILLKVQNSLWRGCWQTKQTNKQTSQAGPAARSRG